MFPQANLLGSQILISAGVILLVLGFCIPLYQIFVRYRHIFFPVKKKEKMVELELLYLALPYIYNAMLIWHIAQRY